MKRNFGTTYDNPTVDYGAHNWATEQQARALIASLPSGAPSLITSVVNSGTGGFEVTGGTGPTVTIGLANPGVTPNQFLKWNGSNYVYETMDPTAFITRRINQGIQITSPNSIGLIPGGTGVPNQIMIWNGSTWSAGAVPPSGGPITLVQQGSNGGLEVDGGTGPAVIVSLTTGVTNDDLMVWSGTAWAPGPKPSGVTSVTAGTGMTITPNTGAVVVSSLLGKATMTLAQRGDVLFYDTTDGWVNRRSRNVFPRQKRLTLITNTTDYTGTNLNCCTNGIDDLVNVRTDNGMTPLSFVLRGVTTDFTDGDSDDKGFGTVYGTSHGGPGAGPSLTVPGPATGPGVIYLGSGSNLPDDFQISLHLTGYVNITNKYTAASATTINCIYACFLDVDAEATPAAGGNNYTTFPWSSAAFDRDGEHLFRGPTTILTGTDAKGYCTINMELGNPTGRKYLVIGLYSQIAATDALITATAQRTQIGHGDVVKPWSNLGFWIADSAPIVFGGDPVVFGESSTKQPIPYQFELTWKDIAI